MGRNAISSTRDFAVDNSRDGSKRRTKDDASFEVILHQTFVPADDDDDDDGGAFFCGDFRLKDRPVGTAADLP